MSDHTASRTVSARVLVAVAALAAGIAILGPGSIRPGTSTTVAQPPDESSGAGIPSVAPTPDNPYEYCYPEYPIFDIGGNFLGCVKDM